ncbi:MAG: TrmH family RNA methyltransferase [Lutibacter sp.]|nr:TrmH family RNA methyltransferase [Lutibacter sp.]
MKSLVPLKEKARARKQRQLFLIEGKRELSLAIQGGYELETVLFDPSITPPETLSELLENLPLQPECMAVSSAVYGKLALRGSTEGIIGVAKAKPTALSSLVFKTPNPLILVAEATEKPGNIGALLRTADAAGVTAVILADPGTDLYNPQTIRSSVGGIFTNQIATGTTQEIITFLQQHKIDIYSAALSASVPYQSVDYKTACAIVVGTEATGLSEEWLRQAKHNIRIHMRGKVDSMNLSVSAGIIIFEAIRQRSTTSP